MVLGTFQNSIDVVATLAPKFAADVKSEVTATVVEVFVAEWVPVRKGDRLARFDTTEMEAGIAALKAVEAQSRVAESRATREYERAGGVPILDTVTRPCKVTPVGRNTFRIVLTQGLNRQIRRMCEHYGYTVRRLQRVRIMHVHLGTLPIGRWRPLTAAEMRGLLPPRRRTLSLK